MSSTGTVERASKATEALDRQSEDLLALVSGFQIHGQDGPDRRSRAQAKTSSAA